MIFRGLWAATNLVKVIKTVKKKCGKNEGLYLISPCKARIIFQAQQ